VRPLASRLAEAEERFRAVADTANDAIISADARGSVVYFNRAAERCFGYSRDEIVGRPLTLLMPARFIEPHAAGLQRLVSTGEARLAGRTVELAARRKDGSEFPMEISVAAWKTARGAFFTAILRDIAHRKRNEEHLRLLNAELEKRVRERAAGLTRAQAMAKLAHVITGPDGAFQTWSDTLPRLAGLAADELPRTTREWLQRIHPEDRLRFRAAAIDAARTARRTDLAYRLQRPDGGIVHVVQAMEPLDEVPDADGRFRWFNTLQDVTTQKHAEDEIRALNEELELRVRRRTAELEAANRELEAFSYSVSHDLRAPLRHIDGFGNLLAEDQGSRLSESGARFLAVMRESAGQMGRLIDDLLAFSRMGRAELHYQRFDMAALAAEVVAALAGEIGGRKVQWDIAPLPEVRGDRAMLRQVWANLLGNAVKYTRRREIARISVGYERRGGEHRFSVADNGAGFNEKYAQKLFGVFQRLHGAEEFEGTGVGLASVQRIVTRHRGTVRASGKVGEGAIFSFTLPIEDMEEK
ncbi:MAG: sensor histidine kinase, partial [Betaproteobacteria bacterium]